MGATGFSSKVVQGLAGITYRQLDYWARTGLIGSSVRAASGRGSRRAYAFGDLVALRVVARLLDAGVSLQAIRRAVKYLKRHADRPLSTLVLIAKGKRVFALAEDAATMIEATANGQVVIAIAVTPIVQALSSEVTQLREPREATVRVGQHSFRAVMTPDLEAGGYTVEIPELPGCVTEGDTLTEAKAMAREAIAEWLLAAKPARAGSRRRSSFRVQRTTSIGPS